MAQEPGELVAAMLLMLIALIAIAGGSVVDRLAARRVSGPSSPAT